MNESQYNHHGHLLKQPKLKPIENVATPFWFEGILMTGFKKPQPITENRLPTHEEEYDANTSSAQSTSASLDYNTIHSPPCSRKTYLSNLPIKSPGPVYNTAPSSHYTKNPTKTDSYKFSFAPSIYSPTVRSEEMPILLKTAELLILQRSNICTPSQTSKVPRALQVDWSSSKVPRFKGLHYSTKPVKKRTILPWGNQMRKVEPFPCVLARPQRFLKQDDRCSAVGGTFSFCDKDVQRKVFKIEANILAMRENIWRTLRPKGSGLLNFPKTLHEKLAEKNQLDRAIKIRKKRKSKQPANKY